MNSYGPRSIIELLPLANIWPFQLEESGQRLVHMKDTHGVLHDGWELLGDKLNVTTRQANSIIVGDTG